MRFDYYMTSDKKAIIGSILVCSLFFLGAGSAFANLQLTPLRTLGNANSTDFNIPPETLWWRTPLYIGINQYLSVALHEESHALVARLMGYEVEKIEIGFWQGEIKIRDAEKMKLFQNISTSLAGPFANRLAAVAIDSFLDSNENSIDENIRSFLGTAYIWNRGNFALYLFRSAVGLVLPGEFYSDWTDASYRLAGSNITLAYVIIGGFIALEVWDLYSSREEIGRNYNRMLGRSTVQASTNAVSNAFQVAPYGAGFIVAMQWVY